MITHAVWRNEMTNQTRGRVLVVDNNDDVLTRLGSELTEAGYEAITTWSGIEAINLLESEIFDSLLVDDYLPDLYIGEFLARVSDLPFCPKVLLMQTKPTHGVCTVGSLRFVVVDKAKVSRIIQALSDQYWGQGSRRWIQ